MNSLVTNEPVYFPWIRVNLAVELCIKEALVETLHNKHSFPSYNGLPEDETQLYQVMEKCRLDKSHELQQIFNKTQWCIVCPSTGKSSSLQWDITKLVAVIRSEVKLSPAGGWKRNALAPGDVSIGAFVFLARNLRNAVKHGSIHDVSVTKGSFGKYWSEIESILKGLSYSNMALFNQLECGPLDKFMSDKIDILQNRLQDIEGILETEPTNKKADEIIDSNISKEFDILKKALEEHKRTIKNEIEQTKHDLKSVQSKVEVLEERVFSVEEPQKSGTATSFDDTVSPNVWHVLNKSNNFSVKDWKTLAHYCNVNFAPNVIATIWQLHFSDEKMQDKISSCFRSQDISWGFFYKKLKQMEKEDVLEELIAETNLTTGFDSEITCYQKKIFEEFSSKFIFNPFLNKHGQVEVLNMQMAEAYVELSIMKGAQMDERWCKNDRVYHLESLDMPKESVTIDEIVSMNDRFIIIGGIAGIGKTMLFNKMVLEWSSGNLFTDIKLLFYLRCSELNTFSVKDGETCKNSLRRLFADVLCNIDLSLLKFFKEKILLVIDGIDEFQWIGELSNPRSSMAVLLCYLMNTKKSPFFGKVIVFGRPSACGHLQSVVKRCFHLNATRVEISGFSAESIDNFIGKYVSSESSRHTVCQRIHYNKTLQAMVRVPIYLSVICSLFQEDATIPTPSTSTELLLYSCLVFLRSHFKSPDNNPFVNLKSLCATEKILRYIINVSAISYQLMLKNQLIFHENVVNSLETNITLYDLECTGLIVKSGNGELGSEYQFRHMVLQELFTALYIFTSKKNLEANVYYEDVNLRSCLPLISGLEGIYKKTSVLSDFLENLVRMVDGEFEMNNRSSLMEYTSNRFLAECFTVSYRIKDQKGYILKTLHPYYECFFEMQGTISSSIIDTLQQNIVEEVDALALNSFQLEQLLYFWHKVTEQCSQKVTLKKVRLHLANNIAVPYVMNLLKVTEKFFFRLKCFDGFSIGDYFEKLDQEFLTTENLALKSFSVRSLRDYHGIPSVARFSAKHLESVEIFNCVDVALFLKSLSDAFATEPSTKLRQVTLRCGLLEAPLHPNCFPHLERIVLTKLPLTGEHTTAITDCMNSMQHNLKELFLNNCSLTDDTLVPLIPCIKYLRHLCLCGNDLTEKSLVAIGDEMKALFSSKVTFNLKLLTVDIIFEEYVVQKFYPKYKDYLESVDIDFAYGEFDVECMINY